MEKPMLVGCTYSITFETELERELFNQYIAVLSEYIPEYDTARRESLVRAAAKKFGLKTTLK